MHDPPSTRSAELAAMLARDDAKARESAWKSFFDRYERWIVRICRWRLGRSDARHAEDLAHEVLSNLVQNLGQYRPIPGKRFHFWLLTISRNAVNDHFRRVGRRPPGLSGGDDGDKLDHCASREPWPGKSIPSESTAGSTGNGQCGDAEMRVKMRHAWVKTARRMDLKNRKAFKTLFFQGARYAEVAARTGRNENDLRRLVARTTARLRQELIRQREASGDR